jgi:uncharacterized caspase-like protein
VKLCRHASLALALALAGLAWASPGQTQSRVALVIGNTAYEHTRVLPNARNDAEALAALFERIGFKVTLAKDLGYRAMRDAIRTFGRAAAGAEIAAVYFAGHGIEVSGENWLMPTDAKLVSDADLDYEAVTLASLLDALKGRGKLGLVILDACRNNPIADRMKLRAGVTRSVSRGLGRPEPASDMLIAYSAKANTLAQDGTGRHSPYAAALLAHLAAPGLDVRLVFGHVRDTVLAATNNAQQPDIYVSLGGSAVTLVPGTTVPAAPNATATEPPGRTDRRVTKEQKTPDGGSRWECCMRFMRRPISQGGVAPERRAAVCRDVASQYDYCKFLAKVR